MMQTKRIFVPSTIPLVSLVSLVFLSSSLPATDVTIQSTTRPPFSVKIEQSATLEGMEIAASYDAHFDPGTGRFRVEGAIRSFSDPVGYRLIVTSDGSMMKQLVISPSGATLCTYDLAKIQQSFPDFDPASAFSPLAYLRLLSPAVTESPAKEIVHSERVLTCTIINDGKTYMPTWHAVPLKLPDIHDITLSVAEKDGIPRHVQITGSNGENVMTIDYKEVKVEKEFADNLLEIATLPGAVTIDATPLLTTLLEQAAPSAD